MTFRGIVKEGYLTSRGYAALSLRFTKSLTADFLNGLPSPYPVALAMPRDPIVLTSG
jgi:hypothetical protein